MERYEMLKEPPSSHSVLGFLNKIASTVVLKEKDSKTLKFLRLHWKFYGKMKAKCKNPFMLADYYERILELNKAHLERDESGISKKIDEVNKSFHRIENLIRTTDR
jgi:hypothetical protein